jgi:hypothetical protein
MSESKGLRKTKLRKKIIMVGQKAKENVYNFVAKQSA